MVDGPRPSRTRGRAWPAALVALLAAAGAAASGYLWVRDQFLSPGPGAGARVEIGAGATLHSALGRLQEAGSIRSARAVQWYLRLRGLHPRVLAGTYDIPPQASPAQILDLLEQGKVVLEQITVVEGSTFADFLSVLAEHPHVVHTLTGKTAAEVMAALGHAGEPAEGEFFPDTYRFAASTADATILARAWERMQSVLSAAWGERRPDLPLATPYQALILASMVEKEAALKSERALIAGVFINRLRRGMRLQSDPTVIYGLGERYDGNIHTRDLLRDTPYNTYTRAGLPPTPIALAGRDSVLAAVQPAQTAALYFVATGVGDGAHHFSDTLAEHNSAVQTYLARLRSGQRDVSRGTSPATTSVAAGAHADLPAAGTRGVHHP
jgi:UPF0755 protein